MSKIVKLLPALATLLLLTAALPAPAAVLSADGKHDIEALLGEAKKSFDLSGEDAVYLLDASHEVWTAEGRLRRTVHQIVYIRTAYGIRRHADLRVPYDSSHQSLELKTLRTWRPSDARWIEGGETARVETLPFALRSTPDYAGRRETMLLHDGVELPCVVETVYTIEDTERYRAGVEGVWTPVRGDPVLQAQLILDFPVDDTVVVVPFGELKFYILDEPPREGFGTYAAMAGPVDPLPDPHTPETMAALPRVAWSSWLSWKALGMDLLTRFDARAVPDAALREALEESLSEARSVGERARLVAAFVEESTSETHYEIGWWPAPRPAARTWATAYGGALDRTLLAAALFREAGFVARLALRARGLEEVDPRIPTLAWAEGPGLWLSGEGLEAFFDPHGSRLSDWREATRGRVFWRPGLDEGPGRAEETGAAASRFGLRLDLSFDGEEEVWAGSGVLTATAALSPFAEMSGLGGEARAYLGDLLAAVLEGAEVTGYNPEIFTPSAVTVGFDLRVPAGERDERGRLRLSLGDHALSPFLDHAGASLHQEERESALVLPGPLEQRIELHLVPGDLELVYLPSELKIDNEAGGFALTASVEEVEEEEDGEKGGEIVLLRSLTLAHPEYAPEAWPELRALLLADAYERSRMLLLE